MSIVFQTPPQKILLFVFRQFIINIKVKIRIDLKENSILEEMTFKENTQNWT